VDPSQPQLLIDSDAFCKLAAANLLDDALALLGLTKAQCARLPSLPHMLRRGHLRKTLGDAVANALDPIAQSVTAMDEPSEAWLEPLVANPAIDVGEAQIYALAAEHESLVLTGDKRSVVEVSKLPQFRQRLDGRVVTLEAVLLGLAGTMTEADLRSGGSLLARYDSMARAVFSSPESSLKEGLESYLGDLQRKAGPMALWRPGNGGREQ
jgi:hypothetical protein